MYVLYLIKTNFHKITVLECSYVKLCWSYVFGFFFWWGGEKIALCILTDSIADAFLMFYLWKIRLGTDYHGENLFGHWELST